MDGADEERDKREGGGEKQREVIAGAEIRDWKWRAVRIKAICITAPLSFPLPFIYPPRKTLPHPPPHPFQQTHRAIPQLSNGKLPSRVVRRKIYNQYLLFIQPYSDPSLFFLLFRRREPSFSYLYPHFSSHQNSSLPNLFCFLIELLFSAFSVLLHFIFYLSFWFVSILLYQIPALQNNSSSYLSERPL